jgi:hypothetical protein
VRFRLATALTLMAVALAAATVASAAAGSTSLVPAGFELFAEGGTVQIVQDSVSSAIHPQAEGTLGKAVATMGTGPVGYALAASAWPGPTAADAGTLAVFAGAPSQATAVNDPVRAEARTGSGSPDATYASGPMQMHAHAEGAAAQAEALVQDESAPGTFSVGNQQATALSRVDGAKAASTATTRVDDITIGVVHIGAVVSEAVATVEGTTVAATGGTTVTGMTVGRVKTAVDETGVHVVGTDAANPAAASAVQQVLRQAGITMAVSEPVRQVGASTASYTAGSLIVTQKASDSVLVFAIGGAVARTALVLADAGPLPVPDAPALPGSAGGAPAAQAPSPTDVGSAVPPTPSAPASSSTAPVTATGRLAPAAVTRPFRPVRIPTGLLLLATTAVAIAAAKTYGGFGRILTEDPAACRRERSELP